MSQLTREHFIEQLQAHVRQKFPLVRIARAQQHFSLLINGHVAPLENLYRITVLEPADLQRHVDRWIVELLRATEGAPDHDGSFEQLRDRVFPMILSSESETITTGFTIQQPFLEGLAIAYALDSDRTISYIPAQLFRRWGVSLDQLHASAIQNLVNRSESLNARAAQDETGRLNLVIFQTLDGYDASRLLLPTLHDYLREHLGSPFAAAIPNRDILLCFRNDTDTVARLEGQIAEDYRQMPHQITDRLLLVTPDGIALH